MPTQPTYPGVYVEEIPSGVRTISSVSTSVTAFVGRARKGPLDEPVTIFNYGDYDRHFGGLWEKSPMSFAVRDFFLNGGGEAVIVRVFNPINNGTEQTPELDDGLANLVITLTTADDDQVVLEARNPGSWGKKLKATIEFAKIEGNDQIFNLVVEEEGGAVEKFLNITTVAGQVNSLDRILEQGSRLVRFKSEPGMYPNLNPGDDDPAVDLESTIAANTGNDGLHINDENLSAQELKSEKRGLYALEKTDIFNMLCIPPYTGKLNDDDIFPEENRATDVTKKLLSVAIEYCIDRNAILLIDPHSSWNTPPDSAALDTHLGPRSDHAALFFPRLKQVNPLRKNQIEDFVPCGTIAGIIARTDTQRGIWKAPAGTDATIVGIVGLTVGLTDQENGKLNQLGVNCLRTFPIYGSLVWGARTSVGADQLASEWKYISVRRTALFIKESLHRGLKWVVFEPNDEPLWSQIRLNVGAFMQNLFRQGAFQGKKSEAYFVKCDAETTTQNDIDNGIVNVLVGFAPLKPAEFVIVKLQQLAGQVVV